MHMISLDDPPSSHGNHEKYFVMKLVGNAKLLLNGMKE